MNMNPMVSTIVQEIMITNSDLSAWRNEIIKNQIFSAQEVKKLSEKEVSLVHQALLTQRLSQLTSDELMGQVDKYNLNYHLDLEEGQLQAICY